MNKRKKNPVTIQRLFQSLFIFKKNVINSNDSQQGFSLLFKLVPQHHWHTLNKLKR